MRFMGLVITGAFVATLFAGLALAGSFDVGLAAYNRKDYSKAAQVWRKAADSGDTDAQVWLGIMYFRGLGMPSDHAIALMWEILAAAHGSRDANETIVPMIKAQMTPDQVTRAERMAQEWRRKD